MIFFAFFMYILLAIRKFTLGVDILPSPLFMLSTMIMIMGFQSILMGLIAELLSRTYHESQAKPTYTVRKVIREKSEAL
jgi:hypothetical protein